MTDKKTPEPDPNANRLPDTGYTTRKREGLENQARNVSSKSATTLFQPGVMIDSILSDGDPETGSDTWVLRGQPRPPELRTENRPYLLVVGAPAGTERIDLVTARTTFGRDRGDVRLDDSAVSAQHFQVDAVGNDFFVRDLGSRNGTNLNGHPIRYSELLPGDEIRAGETCLIFRIEGDDISKR